MKKILFSILLLAGITATAQVKVGSNPTTINTTTTNFQVEGTTTGDQFVVLKNGNVGIATTSPTVKLDIAGPTDGTVMRLTAGGLTNNFINFVAPNIGGQTDNLAFLRWTRDNDQGRKLSIHTATNAGVSNTAMTVDYTGNVGIGTTAPASKLHVQNGIITVDGGDAFMPNGGQDRITFFRSSFVTLGLGGVGSDAPFIVRNSSTVQGQWNSSGWTSSSDARLKENVKSIESGLDKILQLRPVTYSWKNLENKNSVPGFIAQEVEVVIPEIVSSDERGYRQMGYQNIVPYLVSGMKEQQSRINELEQKLKKLEEKLDLLLKEK